MGEEAGVTNAPRRCVRDADTASQLAHMGPALTSSVEPFPHKGHVPDVPAGV